MMEFEDEGRFGKWVGRVGMSSKSILAYPFLILNVRYRDFQNPCNTVLDLRTQ